MSELIPRGVMRFNMSIADVGSLTIDEYFNYLDVYLENKKFETTLIRDAMLNAIVNTKRKKNTKFQELFKEEKEVITIDNAKEEIKSLFGKEV